MKKKYIIFDFDGTLVNTNRIITDSWQACFRHYQGREMPLRTIEATFGEILTASVSRLIPEADVDEVVAYYRKYQNEHQNEDIVYVFDGVRELLAELRSRGCLIGVGTSRTANSFWDYMRMFGMEEMVDEVVTMNDVTHHKPHPETAEATLLKLMAHDKSDWCEAETLQGDRSAASFDITIPDSVKAQAIMIGDAKYDIGCAQNAGIDSALVGWSHYVDEEDMAANGFEPTYRINTPAELLKII